MGVLAGIVFGEYCRYLSVLGQAYVGLLQMTVLPYLTVSLTGKLGKLDLHQARKLAIVAILVLLLLVGIGIGLIVVTSLILPPAQGASFFSPQLAKPYQPTTTGVEMFIPTNIFRSLSDQVVPAVVVFCLFFGVALMRVPGKEGLLRFLDLCSDGIGRINLMLVKLAPFGLFTLTADAAGTLRLDEITRLQAYLVMFSLACLLAGAVILPILVKNLTNIKCRDFLIAAQEPLLTALATGKLFVVLPQIVEKCERLMDESGNESDTQLGESTANVVVPLAYPFPHLGKILAFVFVTFAAWYAGQQMPAPRVAAMASTGAVSSFASPLITIPYLLDEYRLPQDLLPLFILPGFITTRLADMVGVLHLMALTLIVSAALQSDIRISTRTLARSTLVIVVTVTVLCAGCRWYLTSTSVKYDLDKRLLSLQLPEPHAQMTVYRSRDELPNLERPTMGTLERIVKNGKVRVGYHPNHVPYCYFNDNDQLVGLDVDLMNRLAVRLDVKLEFVPYTVNTVNQQLNDKDIDVAIGGLIIKPERLLQVGFSEPYQTATLSIVVRDHRRREFQTWPEVKSLKGLRLAVIYEDVAIAARRELPGVEIQLIDSARTFFEGKLTDVDGLVIAAEEGFAWNVLYPTHTVVIPQPVIKRPVGMAVRLDDDNWVNFLDRWIDFERLDGSLNELREFWIEGGGTKKTPPRWSLMQDVLKWIP